MAGELRILDVTDEQGRVLEPVWLARAEAVHRQLRPALPADYAGRMQNIFASGARLTLAVAGESVSGVALWRIIENTYEGRRLYVDDLVTDEARRGTGCGKALLAALRERAQALDCAVLALDSGIQRSRAHAFYFREGLNIASFCFRKSLT